MSKLFDIPTIVKAELEVKIDLRIVSVRITTTKEKRSAIWHLVVNDDLNPGVARYGYREDAPTTITLTPYPGYDGDLVANMAYAFACIVEARDWTNLFSVPASDFGEENVKTEGFQPNKEVMLEIQRLYVTKKAVDVLNSMVNDLKFMGLNTNAIYAWNREAIECLRRAGGTSTAPASVVSKVGKIGEYANLARAIDLIKLANLTIIKRKVASFELSTAMFSSTELAQQYFAIVSMIDSETTRLSDEVDDFSTDWDEIQQNLMVAIRKATPPAPATPK